MTLSVEVMAIREFAPGCYDRNGRKNGDQQEAMISALGSFKLGECL
ncbi:hypothetical protein [Sphingomonas sp.]|nr:hypothetical protein [Sphingomonas sp.]